MQFVECTKGEDWEKSFPNIRVKPDQTHMMRVAYGRMTGSMLQLGREGKMVTIRSNHTMVDGERVNINEFLYKSIKFDSGYVINIDELCSRNTEFERLKNLFCFFRGVKVDGYNWKWVPREEPSQGRPQMDGFTANSNGAFPFVGSSSGYSSTRSENVSNGVLISEQVALRSPANDEAWRSVIPPLNPAMSNQQPNGSSSQPNHHLTMES